MEALGLILVMSTLWWWFTPKDDELTKLKRASDSGPQSLREAAQRLGVNQGAAVQAARDGRVLSWLC